MDGEDREALRQAELLDRLARAEMPGPEKEGSPEEAELEAVAALLALALEPAAPAPEQRSRLLAALPAREAAPAVPLAPVVDLAEFARRERRAWQAVRFLAAALVLCLVGIAYLAGRSSVQLEAQRAELDDVQRRLHMVTSVARFAYRMQTVSTDPAAAEAPQGMVYVCGHHQQWILSLEHLPPPPPGREYHVRFHTADGEVDGGVLWVGQDARAEKEDVQLPPGTRGFSVTLEPAQGTPGDPLLVLQSSSGVAL